jgi:hypothetical protein
MVSENTTAQTRSRAHQAHCGSRRGPQERRRLHGLGNAVVPQIPEIIGRAIMSAHAGD